MKAPFNSRPLIVAKFGGTSMGNAQAIRLSASIAHNQGAQVVVVSATAGTTNQLVELIGQAVRGSWAECKSVLANIRDRHLQIAEQLEAPGETVACIERTLQELETLAPAPGSCTRWKRPPWCGPWPCARARCS